MAGWLHRIGHRPYLSGIMWNIHAPERTSALLALRLTSIVEEVQSPIILIGHSLGGVLARFLGASAPQYVHHVVTIGSPLSDTPHAVHPMIRGAFLFLHRLRNPRGRISPAQSHFAATASAPLPPGVEGTAIFSRDDEIVDWRVCRDPHGTNYEVPGRHLGLVVNRAVYRHLTTVLRSPSK
jgi:pimeloyl-ACP methyl ester carboxylesterase